MVRSLLQSGAVVTLQSDLSPPPAEYSSALLLALEGLELSGQYDSKDTSSPWKTIVELLLRHLGKPTWLSVVQSAEFRAASRQKNARLLVQKFLDHCPQPQMSHKTTFECTALVEAAEAGNVAVVKLLLNHGADPESVFLDKDAFLAAVVGRKEEHKVSILGILFDKYDAKPRSDQQHVLLRSIIGEYWRGPPRGKLYSGFAQHRKTAAKVQDWEIMRFEKRLTTLFVAMHDCPCAEYCLKRGNIPRFSPSGYSGGPELMEALRWGDTSVARLLLDNGASVDTVNRDGSSVLILATMYGDWDVAEFLLRQGADVNFIGFGNTTPLIEAVSEKTFKPRLFTRDKSGVQRSTTSFVGESLPNFRDKKLQLVSQLLNHGVSTQCRTSDNRTALSVAAGLGDTETVELLVDHGARYFQ
ncbi:uncharacterized protein PG986_010117 [Apiospora aurea]|uniref:Ankyrin n=1 Tax=Apiospora aurea TaxID=335848 RepID=A0ABR1Q9L8_9PEZI